MGVVVLGSLNLDLVVRSPRWPQPGETLSGERFTMVPGGKGANQAVAAARLGLPTVMVGCVGDDAFGPVLRDALADGGVDTAGIRTVAGVASGVATITLVDDENQILIVPGANHHVGQDELSYFERAIAPEIVADTPPPRTATDNPQDPGLPSAPSPAIALLQLEIPLDIVAAAAEIAHRAGAVVILDPAPAQDLPDRLWPWIDYLTPNATEAAILTGQPVGDRASATAAAQTLVERGVKNAIVTLGDQGCVWAQGDPRGGVYTGWVPAFAVTAVDTVGAGDAFNGGLAAAIAAGQPLTEAVRWAAAAGALCASHPGAQAAMPDHATWQTLLDPT